MTTFPFGYTRPPDGGPQGMGQLLTWEQMMTKTTVNRLHPEVQRRFHALIEHAATCDVPLGVGTGWRVQPDPPPAGFAKPGNSWHESCPTSPSSATALAIDTVPNVSWDWMQINSARYGLRSFRYVNNEPWHVQPLEISTSRRYASVLPTLVTWKLPGDEPVTPTPSAPLEDDDTMLRAAKNADTGGTYYLGQGPGTKAQSMDGLDATERDLRVAGGVIDVKTKKIVYAWGNVQAIPGKQVRSYVGDY